MSNKVKELRSQLRQIVKEMMPDLIASELYQSLQKENTERLKKIAEDVQDTLKAIDSRQKDVQNLILREMYNTAQQQQPESSDTEQK